MIVVKSEGQNNLGHLHPELGELTALQSSKSRKAHVSKEINGLEGGWGGLRRTQLGLAVP